MTSLFSVDFTVAYIALLIDSYNDWRFPLSGDLLFKNDLVEVWKIDFYFIIERFCEEGLLSFSKLWSIKN